MPDFKGLYVADALSIAFKSMPANSSSAESINSGIPSRREMIAPITSAVLLSVFIRRFKPEGQNFLRLLETIWQVESAEGNTAHALASA
ncbi:hypothetical protein V8951_00220 (plasmid) [Raoultella ornithinolytica]|uniref:hypothetical protein n=1 Tax=Raoultella ornithinolytica TaxID=54291 RepID=UPI0030D59B28